MPRDAPFCRGHTVHSRRLVRPDGPPFTACPGRRPRASFWRPEWRQRRADAGVEMRDRTRERTRKDSQAMGYLRALVALLAAGLACVALAATASAREGGEPHQFTATKTAEVTVLSSEQELSFDALTIRCKGVKTTKSHVKTVFPALGFLVQVYFIKCTTDPFKVGTKLIAPSKAMFGGPLDIEYRARGRTQRHDGQQSPGPDHLPQLDGRVRAHPARRQHDRPGHLHERRSEGARTPSTSPAGSSTWCRSATASRRSSTRSAAVPAKRSSGPKARKANTSARCRRR